MLRRTIPILFLSLSGCATLSPKSETELRGRRTAYALAGEGTITVVFESGLGDGMDSWEPVFDSVSTFATTFAYDRPGYGRTKDDGGPRTGRDIVENLRGLLTHLEISPPFLLVGHSSGGMYMELFARLHPDEVAGVVLVDARHPEFTQRCEQRLNNHECSVPGLLKLLMSSPMKRELDGAAATTDQIGAAPPFPDIELVVVSRSEGNESTEFLELWMEMQAEYATLSRRGRLVVSEGSGHYVHRDDPQAVIKAIRRVILRARGGFDPGRRDGAP